MRDKQTVELTKSQTFWHYSVVPFLLITPVSVTIDVFKYYVSHTYTGVRPIEDMIFIGYIWIIPAILFFFIQKRRLKFKVINIPVDENTFKATVEQTARELDWRIEKKTSKMVIATTGFSWRSWGERITIIRGKEKILFNSICDPDNRPSVTSGGMNKLNRKTFEQFLQQNLANKSFDKI